MEAHVVCFEAMGTEVELLSVQPLAAEEVDRVKDLFRMVEEHLSRFRPDSELCRLNASHGQPFRASALLLRVLQPALAAARATAGRFDPTVLDAVESSGYCRSFRELPALVERRDVERLPDYRRVHIDGESRITLEQGTRIDLGGFAKGWTVDAAVELLGGRDSYLVNAGGDLRAVGPGVEGDGWLVGIQDPHEPDCDLGVIRLTDVAVATSSTSRRRWRTQDGAGHHLIDPRTGRPAMSGLAAVTVVAPTTAQAEVLAKSALILGLADGRRFIESQTGTGAVLVGDDGHVTWTGAMEAYRES